MLLLIMSLALTAANASAHSYFVMPETGGDRALAAGGRDVTRVADTAEDYYARVFTTVDADGDGRVSIREATRFQRAFFAAMDYNSDGKLERSEFTFVDFGESYEAARQGREDEVRAVLEAYFDEIDKSGDEVISNDEHILIFLNDFRNTDKDGDGGLSKEEFALSMPIFARMSEALGW